MDIETTALIIAGLGLILTGIGSLTAGTQLRASQRVAAGQFLLSLDQMLLDQHNEVHQRLRPGGKWAGTEDGPSTAEEWIMVERYMGLFERVQALLDYDLLEIQAVDSFYGYRILNIVANKKILYSKHLLPPLEWKQLSASERKKHPWKHFIELWHAIEKNRVGS